MPIYINTTTWKEFFAEIYKIDKKCRIMFPWYIRAVASAMGGMACAGQTRIIDIYKSPNELVEYNEVRMGGGETRKFMEYGEPTDYILEGFGYISIEHIYNIQYTKADLKLRKYTPI